MSLLAEAPPLPYEPAVDGRRAAWPDETGYVERDGVRTYYEVYGEGDHTVVLLPAWTIFHSRFYKTQIPYLARHFRVVAFDGRGGGQSDRPLEPRAYGVEELALDTLAVMDATATDRASFFGASRGAQWAIWLATERPERVRSLALCGPFYPASWRSLKVRLLMNPRVFRVVSRRLPAYPGWLRFSPQHMTTNYTAFLDWFVGEANSDRHSTRAIESMMAYALESTGAVASATVSTPQFRTRDELLARARAIRCPLLVVAGTADRITPYADAKLLARAGGGRLITLPGRGHVPSARYPVLVNAALREFFDAARETEPR